MGIYMKNALILHGKPTKKTYYNPDEMSSSNSIWIPWLQQQLLINGVHTQAPEMPMAWQPDYKAWTKEFERYDISNETILVGHSCGAGFLVQWLSEHKNVNVGDVFLIAPWMGEKGTDSDPEHDNVTGGFFDFEIDPDISRRAKSITVFHSDNDFDSVTNAVSKILSAVPNIEQKQFHGYGHFRSRDLGGNEFPELFEAIHPKLSKSS